MTIVYALISSPDDLYVSQALMSIWSCRIHNPNINISVVTDEPTSKIIASYPEFKKLVNEVKIVNLDTNFTNFEKSRILKTQIRQILSGDLLFVDTDTIFCEAIDEKDFTAAHISMVEDIHSTSIGSHPFRNGVVTRVHNLFDVSIDETLPYFNSGVIFYRDTPTALEFSKEWYHNWSSAKQKEGGKFDQPALLYTVSKHPEIVESLKNDYNSQVLGSVRYLYSGKILHFFNANWGRNSVHPFLDKHYYESIKQNKGLSEKNKEDILNTKNLFSATTFIIGPEDVPFWLSPEVRMLRTISSSKFTKRIVRNFLRLCNLNKHIKHKLIKSNTSN